MGRTDREQMDLSLLQGIVNIVDLRAGIIDADSTLFDTSGHFDSHMRRFVSYLADHSEEKESQLLDLMRETIGGLRGIYGVHPTVMAEAARIVSLYAGSSFYSGEIQAKYEELMSLYATAPKIFPGVKETLELIGNAGLKLVLFTHSSPEWTEKKLRAHSLGKLFTAVFNIDPLKKKGVEELRKILGWLGAGGEQVIVVGDNWASDIMPAIEGGIPLKHIFRVKTSFGEANKARVAGVMEIEKFSDLPEAVIENLS